MIGAKRRWLVVRRRLRPGLSPCGGKDPLARDGGRVVQDAVEDGVGHGGVAQVLLPLGVGELAGDDGRPVRVAVLDDLEEVVTVSLEGGAEGARSITSLCLHISRVLRMDNRSVAISP